MERWIFSTVWITRVSHKIGLSTKKGFDYKVESGKAPHELDSHKTDIYLPIHAMADFCYRSSDGSSGVNNLDDQGLF